MSNKLLKWPNTTLTQLLNIRLPIIQAPMAGGATTIEMVAAVSNSGGLGSFAAGYLKPEQISLAIDNIRKLTERPFAVNLFIPEASQVDVTEEEIERTRTLVEKCCPELHFSIPMITPPYTPSFEQQLKIILTKKVPIVSFTFGVLSDPWIKLLKKAGSQLIGTATNLAEAQKLEQSDIDAVVAQGKEAGGHRGSFLGKPEDGLIPLSSLLPELIKQLKIPVLAAGGIMNATSAINSLKIGAAGVQMGSVFLCTKESGIHPIYKQAILNSKTESTTFTRAFSGKLARGLINTFMKRMQTHEADILPYPIQNALTSPMRKQSAAQNNIEFMSLWAGEQSYLCQTITVAQLINKLEQEVASIAFKEFNIN